MAIMIFRISRISHIYGTCMTRVNDDDGDDDDGDEVTC